MGIDGPAFVPKNSYFFTNFGQGLSSKVVFFLIFSQFYELAFWTKCFLFSNKKSTFVLISGFFGCCIFAILFKYYLKGRYLTKKAP